MIRGTRRSGAAHFLARQSRESREPRHLNPLEMRGPPGPTLANISHELARDKCQGLSGCGRAVPG